MYTYIEIIYFYKISNTFYFPKSNEVKPNKPNEKYNIKIILILKIKIKQISKLTKDERRELHKGHKTQNPCCICVLDFEATCWKDNEHPCIKNHQSGM